ncbi:hypothetical protein MACK_000539 [Theileria orientalis]|uniref:Uncharacterized protein n=1 Tax=Theileria orientalis TaxID=68886 RepID=A0A976MA51_THEOR|nr:hypothetical protein MACK_000539 [Theileria orientalis]
MQQVHKMVQRRVPNSLEGRDNISSSIQGMNGVPSEVIEEHRMQHMQKLANIKRQKQQRISWTQINAPGFTNRAMTMQNNTGLHTNVSNMPPGMGATNLDADMTNNFANAGLNGSSAMAGGLMANPLASNMTNGMGPTMTLSMGAPLGSTNIAGSVPSGMPTGMAPGMTSAASDADGKNKLLILDANGTPISQPAQSSQQPVQPTVHQSSKQSSFLQSNKILYKSNFSGPTTSQTAPSNSNMDTTHAGGRSTGFDGPSSGFDRPTSGFDRPASGFDRPSSGFSSAPSSFSAGNTGLSGASASADYADSKPIESVDDSSSHTTFYKATGLQPLYVPTPALDNTKLSYASDTVSIEELRAKIKYNWHETQT